MTDRDLTADVQDRQAACAHAFPYDVRGVVSDCERCDLPYADWQAQQEGHVARRLARPRDEQLPALAKAIERGDIWKRKAIEIETDRDRLAAELRLARAKACDCYPHPLDHEDHCPQYQTPKETQP